MSDKNQSADRSGAEAVALGVWQILRPLSAFDGSGEARVAAELRLFRRCVAAARGVSEGTVGLS